MLNFSKKFLHDFVQTVNIDIMLIKGQQMNICKQELNLFYLVNSTWLIWNCVIKVSHVAQTTVCFHHSGFVVPMPS